jgi:hypothetical protein
MHPQKVHDRFTLRATARPNSGPMISFIPPPGDRLARLHHIWGRPTTIHYPRPLRSGRALQECVVVGPGGANVGSLVGVARVRVVPRGILRHIVLWEASPAARFCYNRYVA